MKKIILYLFAAILIASCVVDNDTRIKSVPKNPNIRIRTYLLDTLDNGHILMYEKSSHERCCIEYPECPKCKENLVHLIDSIIDDRVVKLLGKPTVNEIHIY